MLELTCCEILAELVENGGSESGGWNLLQQLVVRCVERADTDPRRDLENGPRGLSTIGSRNAAVRRGGEVHGEEVGKATCSVPRIWRAG